MTEIDVSLTDYAVAVECACFTYLLWSAPFPISTLTVAFVVFFLSTTIAATAGGTVHGFFSDEGSGFHRVLWPFTLICVGVTALSGIQIGAALLFSPSAARLIDVTGMLVFLAYAVVILFFRSDYSFAVLNYLPSLIFLASAFLIVYLRSGRSTLLLGFLGVCIMLFAAGAQRVKLGIHPRYFNHNAVYHMLQAFALWMIFAVAQDCVQWKGYAK